MGVTGLRNYLTPGKGVYTPLVELPSELNPYARHKVRICAKLMNSLPLGNVKSLPAWYMLSRAARKDRLAGVNELVENSSGNTAYSLAVLARLFGVNQTRALVSNEVSLGKLRLLQFFGVEAEVGVEPLCPDPRDTTSGIYKARQLGLRPGVFNPGQYDNLANPLAHRRVTGPQILEQTEGLVSVLCAGMGTTGTVVGTSQFLKRHVRGITTVGVLRKPNNPVPGVRTQKLLKQIAFPWKRVVDYVQEVSTTDAYAQSLALCRRGVVVGPSSGFALQGLIDFIKNALSEGSLDKFRNVKGEVLAVFVCCDSPFPYVEEYFKYLDASYFPSVINEQLLTHSPLVKQTDRLAVEELGCLQAYRMFYGSRTSPKSPRLRIDSHVVLDVRSAYEFADHHLPGSVHCPIERALRTVKTLKQKYRGKIVLTVCAHGHRSKLVAQALTTAGVRAYSLAGGTAAWSECGLPRWQPNTCTR